MKFFRVVFTTSEMQHLAAQPNPGLDSFSRACCSKPWFLDAEDLLQPGQNCWLTSIQVNKMFLWSTECTCIYNVKLLWIMPQRQNVLCLLRWACVLQNWTEAIITAQTILSSNLRTGKYWSVGYTTSLQTYHQSSVIEPRETVWHDNMIWHHLTWYYYPGTSFC